MKSFSFLSAVDIQTIIFMVILGVLLVALLIVPHFLDRRNNKRAEISYRTLRPGMLVKTVGGIIGTIKEVRNVSPEDREMVIETGEGDNKCTLVFDIGALCEILVPVNDDAAAPAEELAVAEGDKPAADAAAPAEEPVAPAAEAPVEYGDAESAAAQPETPEEAVEEKIEEAAEAPVETTEESADAPEATEEKAVVEEPEKSAQKTSAPKSTSTKKSGNRAPKNK